MENLLIQCFIVGILLIIGSECQEFMTLNVPPGSPYAYHPSEELSMALSEMNPVFLYASSQNDFIHHALPEHTVPPNLSRPHQRQRQHSIPRQKFKNSPPPNQPNQKANKPISTPQLTYGFQPKPPTTRQMNNQPRQKKFPHKNPQNNGFRGRRPQEPIYQASIRHGTQTQHQNEHYKENMQLQHRNRQNANSFMLPNHETRVNDFKHQQSYHSQFPPSEKPVASPTFTYNRPNRNNDEHRRPIGENRNLVGNNSQRNSQPKDVNRHESLRKHPTFEDSANAFKDRFNQHKANDGTFPFKVPDNYNGQSLPERSQNSNDRINMQHHVRSMRGENRPQLPARPSFNNGGIRINTLAGELPVLHLESLNQNPTVYSHNNHHDNPSVDDQEKKTYLLIKAPHLANTQSPSASPFVPESLKQTTSPYVVNNYAETSHHVPEMSHSTLPEPRAFPETSQTPAIVLDLVQIPDHNIYNHREQKHFTPSETRPELKSTTDVHEDNNSIHPTESYPTTPMDTYDDIMHHINHAYSLLQHDNEEKPLQKPGYSLLQHGNEEKPLQKPGYSLIQHDNEDKPLKKPAYSDDDHVKYEDKALHKSGYSFTQDDNVRYEDKGPHQLAYSFPQDDPVKYENKAPYKPAYSLAQEDHVKYENKDPHKPAYSFSQDDHAKYENKALPRPKIRDLKKPSNFSSLQPISYSSSVSVVSVKQTVDAKPSTAKKHISPTLKKTSLNKKKPKIPDNEDISYDDYDDGQNVPGDPGIDYPVHKDIPTTSFDCRHIKSPGFYADIDTGCQVFHNCDTGMAKHSFMCPNGTIFHQELLICDWWYNVKCEDSPEFYSLNSGLFISSNVGDESNRKV